jgi:hypothetical protein
MEVFFINVRHFQIFWGLLKYIFKEVEAFV